jgi:hypothetical protein
MPEALSSSTLDNIVKNFLYTGKRELLLSEINYKALASLRKICNPEPNKPLNFLKIDPENFQLNELRLPKKEFITFLNTIFANWLALPFIYIDILTHHNEDISVSEGNSANHESTLSLNLGVISFKEDKFEENYRWAFQSMIAKSILSLKEFTEQTNFLSPEELLGLADQDGIFNDNNAPSVIESLFENFNSQFILFNTDILPILKNAILEKLEEQDEYVFIPQFGLIQYSNKKIVEYTDAVQSILEKRVFPKIAALDNDFSNRLTQYFTKQNERIKDSIRRKSYLSLIELSGLASNIDMQTNRSLLPWIKFFLKIGEIAEKECEDKAELEAEEHYKILLMLLKNGENFISRFLLIDMRMYEKNDRVIKRLVESENVISCTYYLNKSCFTVCIYDNLESAMFIINRAINNFYPGDETIEIFRTLLDKNPKSKARLFSDKKFSKMFRKAQSLFFWEHVPFYYRVMKIIYRDDFPKKWEDTIISQLKYRQLKLKLESEKL